MHLTVGSLKEAGTSEQEFEVVGVVGNSIYESLWQAAPPTVYVPLVQRPGTGSFGVVFEARAAGSLLQVSAALRRRLQPMLPAAWVVPTTGPRALCSAVDGSVWSGTCVGMSVAHNPIGDVSWQLRPLQLFLAGYSPLLQQFQDGSLPQRFIHDE